MGCGQCATVADTGGHKEVLETKTRLDRLIAEEKRFEAGFCEHYYRDCLRFDFGEREKAGLRMFGDLCVTHGLLATQPSDLRVV